jgi:hypothetical protein
MDQIYPDNGLVFLLKQMVGGSGVVFDLFVNNVTPSLNDTPATYTIASWTGYASLPISPSAWTFSQVVAHLGFLQADNIFWTNSSGSPQDVYGYLIWDSTKTFILAAARFDGAPITIPNGGIQMVTPIIGDFSGLTS